MAGNGIAHPCARRHGLMAEFLECAAGEATRGFGSVAAAPERHPDPVAKLRDSIAPVKAAGADHLAADRDDVGCRLQDGVSDPLPRLSDAARTWNVRRVLSDAAIAGKHRKGPGIFEA